MIQSVTAEEWAITQDTKNQTSCSHLARHRCSRAGRQGATRPRLPSTRQFFTATVCAAPVWNQHLCKYAEKVKRRRVDKLFRRCSITLTPKTCGTSPPTQSLRLRICCVPERKTEEEKWTVESEVKSQLQKTCCSSWRRISSSSNGQIPNSQKTDQN